MAYDLPTYDEMCERYGYRSSADLGTSFIDNPKRQPMSVRADSGAEAWTFVMAARERGWIVSDPMPNGYQDVHHVTVWVRGHVDQPNREGTFRHNPRDT